AVEYKDGLLDYKLKGKSLGGTFDLEGVAPVLGKQKEEPKKDKTPQGRLRVRDVHLGRLLKSFNVPIGDGLRGKITLDFQYATRPGATIPEGKGRLTVTEVSWKEKTIAESLSGDIVLADERLRLRNFGGNIGEGTAEVQFTYDLKRPDRSWF